MPTQPKEGDSTAERMAAHQRLVAENELSMRSQKKYWERTRDRTQRKMDAHGSTIKKIGGLDTDGDHLGDDGVAEYKKLAGALREATTLNAVARETLDRLELCYTEEKDDREDGSAAGKA